MLNKAQRKILKEEAGVIYAKVVRVKQDINGYPDLLIEGRDNSGEKWRGWWYEGDGAADIRWDVEDADGWPEHLR